MQEKTIKIKLIKLRNSTQTFDELFNLKFKKETTIAEKESKDQENKSLQKSAAVVRKIYRLLKVFQKQFEEDRIIAKKIREKHGLEDEKSLAGDSEFSKFLEELKLDPEIIKKIVAKYMSRKGSIAADKEFTDYLQNTEIELVVPVIKIEEIEPYIELNAIMLAQLEDIVEGI